MVGSFPLVLAGLPLIGLTSLLSGYDWIRTFIIIHNIIGRDSWLVIWPASILESISGAYSLV